MKAVILAGGFGTRLSEVTNLLPKPMVEIGGKPILWHIMKTYSHYGINDFIICCGYKQYIIKEYFANYFCHNCDMTVNLSDNSTEILDNHSENWRVTMIDTGLHTMTGSRIKRIQKYVGNETFMLTYGDGVCDVNMQELLDFHRRHGKMITLTAICVTERFGVLEISEGNRITSFREKGENDGGRINAGYMVLEPEVFSMIQGDQTVFERETLELAAQMGELVAYQYDGYWQCMDTKREKDRLDQLWRTGSAPWKTWI